MAAVIENVNALTFWKTIEFEEIRLTENSEEGWILHVMKN